MGESKTQRPFQQENESHLTDQTTKIGLCKSASGINTHIFKFKNYKAMLTGMS